MLVEGLGNVTFLNGILRIETVEVKSDGQLAKTGQIEIPGNVVGGVIEQLVQATQGISNKLNELNNETEKDKKSDGKKKNSSDKKKK